MSKVRVYELAKEYGMKGPELADLLRRLGFDNIKSHMAVLDGPDQMMVVARLEAQGLVRSGSPAEVATAEEDEDVLPGMPRKKTLPPPIPTPLRKKLPHEPDGRAEAPAASAAASAPAPATGHRPLPVREQDLGQSPEAEAVLAQPKTPLVEPPAERELERVPREGERERERAREGEQPRPEPVSIAPPPTAPRAEPEERTAADAAAPSTARPVAPSTPAPTPSTAVPARAPVPAPAAPPAEAAAGRRGTAAGAPSAPSAPAAPAPRVAPDRAAPVAPPPAAAAAEATTSGATAAEQAPGAAAAAAAEAAPVKRLLVPQAKAQVVGRIELPQETIRDATRRSAPSTERTPPSGVDRKLRMKALEKTQSRTATRAIGSTRRGPGPAGPGRPGRGRQGRGGSGGPISTVDPNKVVELTPPISVKSLSEALGIKVNDLIATLTFKLGVKGKTINSFLAPEEVELVGLAVERNIKLVERREAEEELLQKLVRQASEEEEIFRAPVVTFMGHVDHGKTSLLDALRASDVAKGEAGGITQHIGAYRITTPAGHSFVVLDTPGHAAFTAMRARGAKLTDIVVLVVAADDGVMPQTEEALAHAKEAGVNIVVAINKCDRPNAKPDQVRQQLAIKGLQPEEWGGSTQMVNVSALTKQGLEDLAEKILLEAELLELKAKPTAPGIGVVVESKQTPEQGVIVNVLVMDGTLRLKDEVICGSSHARVRGMMDDHGRQVTEAGPATPVTLLGLDELPLPGDKLYVVSDTKKAKEVVEERQRRARDISLAERSTVTLETLSEALAAQKIKEVKAILKADVTGSLEPIRKSLSELSTDEVKVNIIHAAVGGITENDVSLAEASKAVVIGFNSHPDQAARQAAERGGVDIRHYTVIYELIDDMKLAIEGMLKPEEVEKITGHAEVRAVFKSSRAGNIAGCYVLDGFVNRNSKVRVTRNKKLVFTGGIGSLKRLKDDVREVKAGYECGMTIANFDDVREGDQFEFYEVELVKRTLR